MADQWISHTLPCCIRPTLIIIIRLLKQLTIRNCYTTICHAGQHRLARRPEQLRPITGQTSSRPACFCQLFHWQSQTTPVGCLTTFKTDYFTNCPAAYQAIHPEFPDLRTVHRLHPGQSDHPEHRHQHRLSCEAGSENSRHFDWVHSVAAVSLPDSGRNFHLGA